MAKNEKNIVETASPSIDQKILDFYSRQSMEGDISLCMNRSPSYFSSVEVEGRDVEVLVARGELSGDIKAVGQISGKTCFVNQSSTPSQVGYVSGLRIEAASQGSFLLFKCFKQLKSSHQQRQFAKIYLTTIMEDNVKAQKILQSKRAGLPTYSDFGLLHSYLLKVGSYQWCPKERVGKNLQVRRAQEKDLEVLVNFLNNWGSKQRQFFPNYTKEDLLSPSGLLRGLNVKDLFLCFEENQLVGTLGVWNQSAFRRWLVKSYSTRFSILRPLYNVYASVKGRPLLPRAGENFDYHFLSLVCVQDDRPEIFQTLMEDVWKSLQNNPKSVLSIGFHHRDPLRSLVTKHPNLELKSRLFVVHWPDGEEEFRALDTSLVPYVELGSL